MQKVTSKEFSGFIEFMYRVMDASLIVISGAVCFNELEPIKAFPEYIGFLPQNYLYLLVSAVLISNWTFPVFNVYRSWRGVGILGELQMLLMAWLATLIVIIGVIFFTKTAYGFSRHWLALWSLFAFLAMSGARFLIRAVLLRVRRHGFNQRSILLIGSASKNHDITCKLNSSSSYGFVVRGFFSPAEKRDADDEAYAKRLGDVADLLPYLSESRVDQVWITLPLQEIELIEDLYQELEKYAVEVRLLPDISSWRLLNHSVSEVIGMPVINITASPMNGVNQVVKWVEDKILSALILLMISPILIVIAIAVKLTSPGPIFYRQERVSWNGKHFEMLKFRSMPVGSDLLGGKQVWGQAKAKQPTRLGAFLRRTSLDELPQFINVLKGDMSIVGPRPERPIFVDQFKHEVDRYMLKHLVKAGITGWAQVNGWRGDTCLKTRVEHDIYYIDNWSLWFDLKIILLTVFRPSAHNNAC